MTRRYLPSWLSIDIGIQRLVEAGVCTSAKIRIERGKQKRYNPHSAKPTMRPFCFQGCLPTYTCEHHTVPALDGTLRFGVSCAARRSLRTKSYCRHYYAQRLLREGGVSAPTLCPKGKFSPPVPLTLRVHTCPRPLFAFGTLRPAAADPPSGRLTPAMTGILCVRAKHMHTQRVG